MDQLDYLPRVLVAPLDWGLGHATRCIPIIRQLIVSGCTVFIASDKDVKALLQAEFPNLSFLQLSGYDIQYTQTTRALPFKIVAQIPKILRAVRNEQAWLKKVVQKEKIDAVISDNRFGLHHSEIISVFITHQLNIKAPLTAFEFVLRKLNYHFINKFDECWIPDAEGKISLAGFLSHPFVKPKAKVRYVGALSRFEKGESDEKKHLLIIISGPEPQRTILEKMLQEDLKKYNGAVVFVRGLPRSTATISMGTNVIVYDHLPSHMLQEKIREATIIVSRCGYSTVMDIAAMEKKAILIPTPGQTEQEFLARHLMKSNFAFCINQKSFRFKNALELAEKFPYKVGSFSNEGSLHQAVQHLIFSIKSPNPQKAG